MLHLWPKMYIQVQLVSISKNVLYIYFMDLWGGGGGGNGIARLFGTQGLQIFLHPICQII